MGAPRLFEARWAGFEHDWLDLLATRSRRLSNVVQAISKKRPTREFRAKLLLLLLDLRAPQGQALRRDWYVAGGVARLGCEGLRRAWKGYFDEDPMTERTFRSHLTELEKACAIVRAPGDWLWMMSNPEHPERRPRFPTTFHVLESERVASWWATRGKQLLEKNPRAKTNPDVWSKVFGEWRREAAKERLDLFAGIEAVASIGQHPASNEAPAPKPEPKALEGIAAALRTSNDPLELLTALFRAGVHVKGRAQIRVIREPVKLAGAAALLAIALARGDKVRNRAGWLLRAFDHAGGQEMLDAWRIVRREDPTTWAGWLREKSGSPGKSPRGRLLVLRSEKT